VEEIDPLLRELIADLNAAGYETFCSCRQDQRAGLRE